MRPVLWAHHGCGVVWLACECGCAYAVSVCRVQALSILWCVFLCASTCAGESWGYWLVGANAGTKMFCFMRARCTPPPPFTSAPAHTCTHSHPHAHARLLSCTFTHTRTTHYTLLTLHTHYTHTTHTHTHSKPLSPEWPLVDVISFVTPRIPPLQSAPASGAGFLAALTLLLAAAVHRGDAQRFPANTYRVIPPSAAYEVGGGEDNSIGGFSSSTSKITDGNTAQSNGECFARRTGSEDGYCT